MKADAAIHIIIYYATREELNMANDVQKPVRGDKGI